MIWGDAPDMKTIFFSGGVIPVGDRFTDFNYAVATAGESKFLTGIDASFTGTAGVPEPATLMLMSAGGVLAAIRRRQQARWARRPDASVVR